MMTLNREGYDMSKLTWRASFRKYGLIYLLLVPAVAVTFVFYYMPMPGIIAVFQDYNMFKGLLGSPMAANHGFAHVMEIFRLPAMKSAVINTVYLSALTILFTFPAPIILALLLNELKGGLFKRLIQSVSYIPHFLSWISIIGIVMNLYSKYGLINDLRVLFGGPGTERVLFLSLPNFFVPNILILSVWQSIGWGSILFLASIAGIDQALYESAQIDGANRFQLARYVTLPGIMPTITIMLIFTMGSLFNSNFDLVYGLQNAFINFEVINTVVFKTGIQQRSYSMAAAVGFMQGIVAFVLTFAANTISKKINGIGVF